MISAVGHEPDVTISDYVADARAAFAVLGFRLIHALGAAAFTLRGDFSFEDQVELCRLFSSEIEYCEENLYAILDELYEAAMI